MRLFYAFAFGCLGLGAAPAAFGQNLVAGYPTSSASASYHRPARPAVVKPLAISSVSAEPLSEETPEAIPAKPAPRPRTLTVNRAGLGAAGTLTVEIHDLMGRPVLRQPRTSAPDNELTLAVPTLPADTYIVRILDAHGSPLHSEVVAYAPRR